jgi:hypothetical protein
VLLAWINYRELIVGDTPSENTARKGNFSQFMFMFYQIEEEKKILKKSKLVQF